MTANTLTLTAIIRGFAHDTEQLLPLLHRLQGEFSCIPESATHLIAKHFNLSRAEVHGVISFYPDFTEEPAGKHQVQLCRAEACQAVGARALQSHAENSLGITLGHKTADGTISLNPVYCLGNCACGPSVRINDQVYGRVDAERFDALLAELSTEVTL